jgi:hypothetical protein
MKFIYETAIYDGRDKNWRILNLSTGSVYSSSFPNEQDALDAIEDGENRDGHIVWRVTIAAIRKNLPQNSALKYDHTTPEGPHPLPGEVMKNKTRFSMGYHEAGKLAAVMHEAGFTRSDGPRGTVYFEKAGKLVGEKKAALLVRMAEAAFTPETLPLS